MRDTAKIYAYISLTHYNYVTFEEADHETLSNIMKIMLLVNAQIGTLSSFLLKMKHVLLIKPIFNEEDQTQKVVF